MAAASVLRAQDFADFRLVVRKVLERNDATVLGHFVREQMRRFAAIKLTGTFLGDALECGGKLWLLQRVPSFKHAAAVQKNLFTRRESLQAGTLFLQFNREFLADYEALFREANGRSHHVGELHSAVGFQSQF